MAGDLIIATRIARPASGTVLSGPNNRLLIPSEVSAIAALYVPADQVLNAVRIAQCESGLFTGAWAWENEDSRGLWQINVEPGAHPELMFYDLFDPQVNAYWMGQLYSQSGWGIWSCAKLLGIT